ncbi:MAG: methyltransferase [Pseudomonadota bacterium]
MSADSEDDLLEQAYERGLAAEKAGDLTAAAAAFREVLRLDPEDHGGAAVRLASIGQGEDPERAPTAYVTTLFDQNAASFDEILVARLSYEVPKLIAKELAAAGHGPYGGVLDLGCGTGLVGVALAGQFQQLVGVDLSEEMLAETDERELYDQLFIGDVVQFLEEEEEKFDLVVAADVFPYLGALEAFFAGLKPCLAQGGVVAFSTETLPEEAFDSRGWKVGDKIRFAHSESYIKKLLKTHGLELVVFNDVTVRMDMGLPIPGHLVIARS